MTTPVCAPERFAISRQELASKINSLPEWARRYIHELESDCDPSGNIQELASLREQVAALPVLFLEIDAARSHLHTALIQALDTDDHIIVGHLRDAYKLLGGSPCVSVVSGRTEAPCPHPAISHCALLGCGDPVCLGHSRECPLCHQRFCVGPHFTGHRCEAMERQAA